MNAFSVLIIFFPLHLLLGLVPVLAKDPRPLLWRVFFTLGSGLERALNRPQRKKIQLFTRGITACGLLGALAFALGYGVQKLANLEYGAFVQLLFLILTMSVMAPVQAGRQIFTCLKKDDLAGAKISLQPYVAGDVRGCDRHAVIRKTLEFCALALHRHFIAPILFFLLGGMPLLFAYAALSAFFEAVGSADPKHRFFGAPVQGIMWLIDFVPVRLSALMILLASIFVPRSHVVQGLILAFFKGQRFELSNARPLIAAFAGGLGVTLGGPWRYSADYVADNEWIGAKNTSAKATLDDLSRGIMLNFVVFMCLMALISMIFMKYQVFL